MSFDVFGMCNALHDIQAEVTDSVLRELEVEMGAMILMDHERQRSIVPRVYDSIVNTEPGGSGANTMIGLAMLGGRACYTSHVGDDEHGELYRTGLAAKGVKPNLGIESGNTGICLVLITPDAQRTLLTYLGRSQDLQVSDVNAEDLRSSKYIYITGYLWDTENQKEAVLFAMREANAAGVKVALSLSDPFCVHRHKDDFRRLIKEHVDLLFGNYAEAQALTDTADPYDAARELAKYADVAAVTLDDKGSLIQQGDRLWEIPAYPATAVDTTGAGDIYAAGLLYGLTQGLPLDVTGRIASYCAAKVVAQLGPRLDSIDLSAIEKLKGGAALNQV